MPLAKARQTVSLEFQLPSTIKTEALNDDELLLIDAGDELNRITKANFLSGITGEGIAIPSATLTTADDSDYFIGIKSDNTLYKITKADLLAGLSSGNGGSGSASFPTTSRYRFSASDLSGLTNGNPVTSTTDSSGNNFTGSSNGSACPTYQTNIINTKPVLLFDGVNDWVDLGNAQIIPDTGDFCLFLVAKYTVNSISLGGGGNTSQNWGIQTAGTLIYVIIGGSLNQLNFTNTFNTWQIYCLSRINGTFRTYSNGGNHISNLANSGAIRGGVNGYLQKTIIGGKWDGSAMDFMNGQLADFCVKLNPTISDINSIGNYYASFYGLTWNPIS